MGWITAGGLLNGSGVWKSAWIELGLLPSMHNLNLILTLTGGLAAALILGYCTQRLGLSPIVGYLLAGLAVGPNTPGFVANRHLAEQLARKSLLL